MKRLASRCFQPPFGSTPAWVSLAIPNTFLNLTQPQRSVLEKWRFWTSEVRARALRHCLFCFQQKYYWCGRSSALSRSCELCGSPESCWKSDLRKTRPCLLGVFWFWSLHLIRWETCLRTYYHRSRSGQLQRRHYCTKFDWWSLGESFLDQSLLWFLPIWWHTWRSSEAASSISFNRLSMPFEACEFLVS